MSNQFVEIPFEDVIPAVLLPKSTARYLGTSERSLTRWRNEGVGPPYLRLSDAPNGQVRYRRADLDAWLEARVVGGVR